MSTNEFLSAVSMNTDRDNSPSSSKGRRKNDGGKFSNLIADATKQSSRYQARSQARPDARIMQNQMLSNLSHLMDENSNQALMYKRKNLEAVHRTLAQNNLDVERASLQDVKSNRIANRRRAIPLQTNRRGIPLFVPPRLNNEVAIYNVALNRNRVEKSERSENSRVSHRRMKKFERTEKSGVNYTTGSLAARFESGKDGIAAIGYDRYGGTSYGIYQIASRPGTMKLFLNFLDQVAPDIGKKLRNAGPANTGSRRGEMPTVWKEIAAREPDRFESLQERFIRESHYEPAESSLRKIGYNPDNFSSVMREVLWSTAVQHGPAGASRIFRQAAAMVGGKTDQEQLLIPKIYALRAQCFASSTPEIRASARRRMEEEKGIALSMIRAS